MVRMADSDSADRSLPTELEPPQEHFREAMLTHIAELGVDLGIRSDGMGRLANIATWLAACQGICPPKDLGEVELIIVGSDSPLASSTLPENHATQVAAAIEEGRSPLVDIAKQAGAHLRFINADDHAPKGPINQLSEHGFSQLIEVGRRFADDAADRGVDMLLLGDLGRGMTTGAAAVVGTMCSIEPVDIVGRGSGIDDAGWKLKTATVRDAMFRVRDDRSVADRVLRRAGNPAIVVMCGLMIQAAERRTPLVFEGAGAAAAGLSAQMLCPGTSDWWLAASVGSEPCEKAALSALQLTPLLDLGVGNGAGLGTMLALPLLRQAVTLTQSAEA